MLQCFESHAEYLNLSLFEKFSLPYIKEIAEKVKSELGEKAPPMVSNYQNYPATALHITSWKIKSLQDNGYNFFLFHKFYAGPEFCEFY